MDNRPREKGFRRRWVAVCIVVAALLAVLLLRLGQFQLIEAGSYQAPGSDSSSGTEEGTNKFGATEIS